MSAHAIHSQPELLTSWKEIAAYLGKGVRTVQRWELQFGLPVRRPNEKIKGIVHATPDELDRWLTTQWTQRGNHGDGTPQHNVREILAVCAGLERCIEESAALRNVNRRLRADMRRSVSAMLKQCQLLRANLARTAPQGRIG